MGSFSIWHWLIVLLVIILVFGTAKLKNIGKDHGRRDQGLQGRHEGRHRRGRASVDDPKQVAGQTIDVQGQGERSDVRRLVRPRTPRPWRAVACRFRPDLPDVRLQFR